MKKFPQWASAYISMFCDPEVQEELEGDILSNYNWRSENNQKIAARLHFIRDVLLSVRFLFSRSLSAMTPQLIISAVLIYWRNIEKNRVTFLLNLTGLYLGICCFLAIYSYYEFEHSYDQHYSNSGSIYRIEKIEYGEIEKRKTTTPYLLSEVAKEQIPGVTQITGAINWRFDHINFQYPEGTPREGLTPMQVRSDFFNLFDFDFIEGNRASALDNPNGIIITEATRQKLFKDDIALGKEIFVNENPYLITGVIYLPINSHFNFDYLLSADSFFARDRWDKQRLASDWHYADFILHYAEIQHGKELEVTAHLNRLYASNKKSDKPAVEFKLHPVSSIHLDESTDWELAENGNGYMVRMLMILGLIVMAVVVVNYTFINIARTSNRLKELGLRNILGSSSGSLLSIIVIENILSVTIATFLALLTLISLPANLPIALPIVINASVLFTPQNSLLILSLVLVISVLASIFPMLLIQKLQPMVALKGHMTSKFKNFSLLKTLATVQAMISLGLIISMLFFHQQLNYLFDKDPGFEVQNVGYMERHERGDDMPSFEVFKQDLLKIPGINSVTASAQIPLRWPSGNNYELVLKGEEKGVMCSRAWIDYDYFKTLEINIIQGRSYSKEIPADTSGIIIGASAAKRMGLASPIGEVVNIFFRGGDVVEERHVIGVVEDFNYRTFHSEILPHYYMLAPNGPAITVNFEDIDNEQVHEKIAALWPSFAPTEAYNFTYMAQHYQKQYVDDIAQRNAIYILAGVVLLLASLGIFGISSFVAKNDIKSVAIRKVLGAKVLGLYLMQTKQYVLIAATAFVLCVAPVYLIVNNWLEGYAYRVDINPLYFIVGFMIVVLIIIAVVTSNILKIAILNPVNTLKDE
jgi:putative ABC transport system permease protein